MAADWRQEYLSSIKQSSNQTPINREFIEAYSQLCDRLSVLQAEKALLQAQFSSSPIPDNNKTNLSTPNNNNKSRSQSPSNDSSDPEALLRLQLSLTEALRSNTSLSSRLQKAEEELVRLRAKSIRDTQKITQLTSENKTVSRKLQDREFELREKRKLVADVQDELAVLNMQLDMVERQRAEKEAENKQLVERFMRRIGQEAEAMNLANEPLFTNKKGGKK
ncbi:autophagy protein 16 [Podospora fimiseda]|uniref:Autophagy protein 16 n=1 Tax=Podospora fimiseda TaxID=252190 RepID=A0AAN7BXN6_9PEZI|nr:autophagy protein 16 [Podospora fimiseda]